METEHDEEQTESSSEPQETSPQPSRNKLRDLRPEKDPIGAGNKPAGPQ